MENENGVTVSGKSNKNKIIIAILVLAVIVVGVYFAMKGGKTGSVADDKSASVATVNGVAIPKATFDTQMASAVASYQAQGIAATSTAELTQIKTQVLDNQIGR